MNTEPQGRLTRWRRAVVLSALLVGLTAISGTISGVERARAANDTGDWDDVIVQVIAAGSGFGEARLHLPASGVALTSGSSTVEGLLIGFVGDFVPLAREKHEIRISGYGEPCFDESFFLTLDIQATAIVVTDKRLRSSCRRLVSWEDPTITPVSGAGRYFRIALQPPVTRPIKAAGVAPAMASTIRHVRVAFTSEPPGSEIYVNDDRLEYRTNIRLGVTSMADIEDEKRFPIRSPAWSTAQERSRYPKTPRALPASIGVCAHTSRACVRRPISHHAKGHKPQKGYGAGCYLSTRGFEPFPLLVKIDSAAVGSSDSSRPTWP